LLAALRRHVNGRHRLARNLKVSGCCRSLRRCRCGERHEAERLGAPGRSVFGKIYINDVAEAAEENAERGVGMYSGVDAAHVQTRTARLVIRTAVSTTAPAAAPAAATAAPRKLLLLMRLWRQWRLLRQWRLNPPPAIPLVFAPLRSCAGAVDRDADAAYLMLIAKREGAHHALVGLERGEAVVLCLARDPARQKRA
jgi:hypothetical protein